MINTNLFLLAVFVTFVINHATNAFNPEIEVNSCSKSNLKLVVYNASDAGTLFVQGESVACREDTSSNVSVHNFDFTACGITWESTIRIVIQKHSQYQTGEDKIVTISCNADLSSLDLKDDLDLMFDMDENKLENITIRPTAFMELYKLNENGDLLPVSGKTVKLSDKIEMAIRLDDEFAMEFDIRSKHCSAGTINIIKDSCSTDKDLFPNFNRLSRGYLSAAFGAFRQTSISGGSTEMVFSCTLKVCLENCDSVTCSDGSSGWGRRKRRDTKKGDDRLYQNSYEDITVGTKLRILSNDIVLEDPDDDICLDEGLLAAGLIGAVGAIGAGVATAVSLSKKARARAELLQQQKAQMANQTRMKNVIRR